VGAGGRSGGARAEGQVRRRVMDRDPYGLRRLYYRPEGGAGRGLRELVRSGATGLDPIGVSFAFGEIAETEHTWLEGIKRVPRGHRLSGAPGGWQIEAAPPLEERSARGLERGLLAALDSVVGRGKRVALALSGGLDSALLLALLASSFRSAMPAVYVLAPRLPSGSAYDESAAAVELARSLEVKATVIEASEQDFLLGLPACVAQAETPLFSAHPVAKHLLFEQLASDEIDVVITGDGADQVFAGAPSEIYLPIVGALAEASGTTLHCPFLDDAVIALAARSSPDPHKTALREVGRGKLPDALLDAPKVARLAPAIDLSPFEDLPRFERLAALLSRPLQLDTPRDRAAWTTLSLACDAMGVSL
jgi:asparagine synthase (glutamine-hydrolysing)